MMNRNIRVLGLVCALAMAGVGVAEPQMPVAVDIPVEAQDEALEEKAAAYEAETVEAENEAAEEAPAAEAAVDAEQVRSGQQMLIDLGYLTGAADGLWGPMSRDATTRYQAARGLEATGTLDAQTLAALSADTAQIGDARALQQRLIDLGYLKGGADGAFGEQSRAALRLFQAAHRLPVTGEPDEATRTALFSEGAQALPARLSGGSKGDRVVELQEKLIQYGFLAGAADGAYGVKTVAAVRRFQNHLLAQGVDESLNITASGEGTSMTLLLLYDPNYSSYLADLKPGDEGEEAQRVERRLASLGYMDAEADGILDDYAVSAAEAFQATAGLEQGKFDRTMIDALFAQDAPKAAHFVPHVIAYGDRGGAVREIQEALVCGGMTVSMPDGIYGDGMVRGLEGLRDYLAALADPRVMQYEDPQTLSVAAQETLLDGLLSNIPGLYTVSDNEMTKRMQRRLHTLYYLSRGSIDGMFGPNTQDALRLFQETNGLEATGTADSGTLKLLFSPQAQAKPLPYRVEVHLDEQRVYVYQRDDAGSYELVQTFVCSSGLGNTTPRGIFLDGGPVNVWHHFKKFDCWARYSFEIEGDIMFHSVLYSERDTETLREGSLYALGQKASHGCVRLSVKNARWLFEHCPRGSLVIVIS